MKAFVYAMLAVTFGYLLISVAPSRLVDLGGRPPAIMAPAEEPSKFGVDEEASKGFEGDEHEEIAEEDQALIGTEPGLSAGGFWDGAYAVGMWMVDVMLALGVYLAVKRRLS